MLTNLTELQQIVKARAKDLQGAADRARLIRLSDRKARLARPLTGQDLSLLLVAVSQTVPMKLRRRDPGSR